MENELEKGSLIPTSEPIDGREPEYRVSRADLVGHLIELHLAAPMEAVYHSAERHRVEHEQGLVDHPRANLSRSHG